MSFLCFSNEARKTVLCAAETSIKEGKLRHALKLK